MKVNVWGINYTPEVTGIAPYNQALCSALHEHGHDVRMVTSFAYYPAWKKAPSDHGRLFRTDIPMLPSSPLRVPVHRCWHYVPERVSTFKRIIHEGSFVLTSFLRQLTLPSPDVYVVISPPLLLGAAAWLLGRIKRRPFVFHVQDLQPDAAAGLGMLKAGWLMRVLYWLEAFAYQKATRVSGIMPGMLEAFQRKGIAPAKLVLYPNGVVLPEPSAAPPPGAFRARHGFSADHFLVVYSGNLGVKQGLDVLVEAARDIERAAQEMERGSMSRGTAGNDDLHSSAAGERIRLVICGEGAQRNHLAALVQRYRIGNVIMLPLQAEAEYREMLVDADVCVITQQAGSGGFFFPSKLLTALAWQKPVLTVADTESELVRALKRGGFGVNVPPGSARAVASAIEQLAGDRPQLAEYAAAGRHYIAQFAMDRVQKEFIALLEALVAETFARRGAIKVMPAAADLR